MVASLADTLAGNPVLLLFIVVAAGFAVGRIRVGGFSLGIAAVLFAGIGAGAIDDRFVLPDAFWVLGLALFVYTVGLACGPGFFAALRRRGLAMNALVVACVLVAALVAVAGHELLGLSPARTVGSFTGAETNTPALAAAIQTLKGKAEFARLSAEPIVGYSLTYPLGVVLPLLAAWLTLRRSHRRSTAPLVVQTAVVERGVGTLAQLRRRRDVTFGRVLHDHRVAAATAGVALAPGDLVSVVGSRDEVDAVVAELGRRAPDEIELDRHDVDFRRMAVSSRAVAGRRIEELDLNARFGAVATRVRRGDVDLIAAPDMQLELGDRIRIVAPPSRMKEVAKFFGDSYRALGEVDVLTFGLGIAAGLALGAVSVPVVGGHFSLGNAGGPLVAGLVLGALGRTGPFVWQPPYTASLTLRQLGMVLFLAGIGLRAGPAFSQAIVQPSALVAIGTGAVATTAAIVVLMTASTKVLHVPAQTLVGVLAGMQTQPAVLAYAADQLDDDRELSLGYASVYPLAIITKIVVAQVLVGVLL